MESSTQETIKDTKHYDELVSKFPVTISIDLNTREKSIKGFIKGWQKTKTDLCCDLTENFAILTGKVNNIIVVDIDIPKEDEIDGLLYIKEQGGIDILESNTLITKTISGGYHVYFKYTPKLKNNSARIDFCGKQVSIDIRSDAGCAFEGRNYNIVKKNCICDIPPTLLDILKPAEKKIEKSMKNTEVNTSNLCELLENLPNKCVENYTDWFKILCVIKNTYSDSGKEIAREWSKKSKKYNIQSFENKWEEIKEQASPTIGTIFWYIHDNVSEETYKSIKNKFSKNSKKTNDIIYDIPDNYNELQTYSSHILQGLFSKCFIEEDGKDVFKRELFEEICIPYMNNFFYCINSTYPIYHRYNIGDDGTRLDVDKIRFLKVVKQLAAFKLSKKRRIYDKLTFEVDFNHRDYNNPKVYNKYKRPNTNLECKTLEADESAKNGSRANQEANKLFDFLLNVICAGHKQVFNTLLDYFAMMLQRGHTGTCLVLLGKKGVGKSFLTEILRHIIGEEYCFSVNDIKRLTQNFNGHFERAILTTVEEVVNDAGSYHQTQNVLKSLITDKTQLIERKGENAYTIKSNNNYILNTNGVNPVNVSTDDAGRSRFFILDVAEIHRNDTEYFDSVLEYVLNNIEDIRGYFCNRPIKGFKLEIPITEAFKDLSELNKTPIDLFMEYGESTISDTELFEDYYQRYVYYCDSHRLRKTSDKYFSAGLKKYNIKTTRQNKKTYVKKVVC